MKLFLSLGSITFVLFVIVAVQAWQVEKDINKVQYRAQVAADADRMIVLLDELIGNMEERDMTSGHAALIFKSPTNDIGQDYQALLAVRERAQLLAGLDRTSPAYNSGLDDLRGTLREINIEAWYYEALSSFTWWLFLISLASSVIAGLIWFFRPPSYRY